MERKKQFKKNDLIGLQELIGKKLNTLSFQQMIGRFYDDNFFMFNFGDDAYTIKASCFVRFSKGKNIILTSTDIHFDINNNELDYSIYDEKQGEAGTLMEINILKMQDALKETKVEKIEISDTADVSMLFENGCRLDLFADCLMENYEFYRYFRKTDDSIYNIVKFESNLGIVFFSKY